MRIAAIREERRRISEAERGDGDVDDALHRRATIGESRAGGTQTSGMPSSRCMSRAGPTSSKSRGTTSTMHVLVAQRPDDAIVSVSGSFENATITRSTGARRRADWSSSSPPSVATSAISAPALARLVVDEADELEPVLGVLLDLARDELADMAGADDDRAHGVGR